MFYVIKNRTANTGSTIKKKCRNKRCQNLCLEYLALSKSPLSRLRTLILEWTKVRHFMLVKKITIRWVVLSWISQWGSQLIMEESRRMCMLESVHPIILTGGGEGDIQKSYFILYNKVYYLLVTFN